MADLITSSSSSPSSYPVASICVKVKKGARRGQRGGGGEDHRPAAGCQSLKRSSLHPFPVHTRMDVVKRINPEVCSLPTIQGLKLIRPKVFPDERGFFCESYNIDEWKAKLDFDEPFLQDNHSYSKFGVIRGLHAQKGMGKLVSVISGSIFDVAVDIRPGSSTFGKWHGVVLDGRDKTCFWIPDGFLHGFQCISEEGAHVVYKCSAVYDPNLEFGINPFDEQVGIVWPVVDKSKWIISERDQKHPPLESLTGNNDKDE